MRRSRELSKFSGLRRVLATLGNRYLHAGLIILAFGATAAVLVFNNSVMPRYTRAGTAFSMPQVTGLSHDAAADTILAYSLGAVPVGTPCLTSAWERGTILAQRPLPGAQVKAGRTVYLKQSDNTRDSVRVPNLVSATISAARNMIQRAQLMVGEVLPDSFPTPYPDVVTRQYPPPDSMVLRRDSVSIWFSTGLGNRLVSVPLVTGLPMSEALDLLREAGLHAKVYPQSYAKRLDPQVLSQSHPAGKPRAGRQRADVVLEYGRAVAAWPTNSASRARTIAEAEGTRGSLAGH